MPGRYGEIFDEMLHITIPATEMKLVGAVCDHTEPATGKSRLFLGIAGKPVIFAEFFIATAAVIVIWVRDLGKGQ